MNTEGRRTLSLGSDVGESLGLAGNEVGFSVVERFPIRKQASINLQSGQGEENDNKQ